MSHPSQSRAQAWNADGEQQQSGTVAASPEQYDQSYLCPVKIGSPAQTLTLDFDTGSADLYVLHDHSWLRASGPMQ